MGNNAVTADYPGRHQLYRAAPRPSNRWRSSWRVRRPRSRVRTQTRRLSETDTLTAAIAVTSPAPARRPARSSSSTTAHPWAPPPSAMGRPLSPSCFRSASTRSRPSTRATQTSRAALRRPVTVAVGTANEQWLNQVYLVELGRAPTQSEFTALGQPACRRPLAQIGRRGDRAPARKRSMYRSRATSRNTWAMQRQQPNNSICPRRGSTDAHQRAGGDPRFKASFTNRAAERSRATWRHSRPRSWGPHQTNPFSWPSSPAAFRGPTVAKELLLSNNWQAVSLVSSYQAVLGTLPSDQQIATYVGLDESTASISGRSSLLSSPATSFLQHGDRGIVQLVRSTGRYAR